MLEVVRLKDGEEVCRGREKERERKKEREREREREREEGGEIIDYKFTEG